MLDNPKDAQAFKDLSTAQQAAGNTDGAIEALQNYVQLRPKNTDVLRELAALYLQQATAAQQRAQILQARSDYLAPGAIRDTIFQIGGSPIQPDPITNAVSTRYETQISAAASEIQTASAQAVEQYRRIAADPAEGPERPARAGVGRTVGERRRDDDRRVQGVPQARTERPDRTRGPADPQADTAVRPDRLTLRG